MFCECLIAVGPLTDTWERALASMVLVNLACCPVKPLSLLLEDGEVLGGSHIAVEGFSALSAEQLPPLLPGLSCSSIAKAKMSACSEVNVKDPNEADEELMLWP